MDLLRALALAFPERYPDLHALTDTDAELDFFNNVAHLQMHRRSRAFKRLANVSLASSCTESADSLRSVISTFLASLPFLRHCWDQKQAHVSALHEKHSCRSPAICHTWVTARVAGVCHKGSACLMLCRLVRAVS